MSGFVVPDLACPRHDVVAQREFRHPGECRRREFVDVGRPRAPERTPDLEPRDRRCCEQVPRDVPTEEERADDVRFRLDEDTFEQGAGVDVEDTHRALSRSSRPIVVTPRASGTLGETSRKGLGGRTSPCASARTRELASSPSPRNRSTASRSRSCCERPLRRAASRRAAAAASFRRRFVDIPITVPRAAPRYYEGSSGLRCRGFHQEDWDLAVGLALVVGVVRVGRDAVMSPDAGFAALIEAGQPTPLDADDLAVLGAARS